MHKIDTQHQSEAAEHDAVALNEQEIEMVAGGWGKIRSFLVPSDTPEG